ncbi:MAG TPA: type IV toxin-antitoxin system AbiEi family antitoxin domain-containing protein [Myxococcota bacterium]|nr:type IV toxin-antitoxin system AbiEi family antitoxin domain-containing protein [Myxococcota bacterium]HRY96662.1 type IV toxin-antitoxin system AbiEi family antitoxin domain-containing protein [Myxococcota bacterium]
MLQVILNVTNSNYDMPWMGGMTKEAAGPNRDVKERLRRLAKGSQGHLVTTRRAAEILGLEPRAAHLALGRLLKAGWLERVKRGLFLILPLEADRKGAAIEDPWILARELFKPCYIGGWSAAEHWGLTEQIFRETFVVTSAYVRSSTQSHLGAAFHLVRARSPRVASVSTLWRGQERIAVSDRERTLADALAIPAWVGGVHHLIDMLRSYRSSPEWQPSRLLARVGEVSSGAAFRRLGYLAEAVLGERGELVEACLARRTTGNVRLEPGAKGKGKLSTRWRLWINVDLLQGGSLS